MAPQDLEWNHCVAIQNLLIRARLLLCDPRVGWHRRQSGL